MKGIGRSIHYWLLNTEKVFLAMIATVVVMSVLLGMDDRETFMDMMNLYLSLLGGIFAVAIMLTASTHYIPQSLSMGATRKETYVAMEFSMHLIMLQILLAALILNEVLPIQIWTTDYIISAGIFYLIAVGAGNAMCACGMKFGNRAAMIIYMVTVLIMAVIGGVFGAMSALKSDGAINILMIVKNFWFLPLIFDIIMGAVCYMVLRKYEVRA